MGLRKYFCEPWVTSISQARGDAREDSDYDVAVFLRDYTPGTSTELYRLADLSTAILDETGEFIHAMPYRAGAYNDRTSLMHEIRREGVELCSRRRPSISTGRANI